MTINPRGTTLSKEHDYIMKRDGVYRHAASTYLITLKNWATLKDPTIETAHKTYEKYWCLSGG